MFEEEEQKEQFEELIEKLPPGLTHKTKDIDALWKKFNDDPEAFLLYVDNYPHEETRKESGRTKEEMDYANYRRRFDNLQYPKRFTEKSLPKRSKNKKYPIGYIKTQILLYICRYEKTETPEIIDYLRKETDIKDTQGIRKHLKDLEENEKIIKRKSLGRGKPDYWYIRPDNTNFKKVFKWFMERPEHLEAFISSKYCFNAFPDLYDTIHKDPGYKKYFEKLGQLTPVEAIEAGLPMDITYVPIAVAEEEVLHEINDMIIQHAIQLHMLLLRFYPKVSFTNDLGNFLSQIDNIQKVMD